jgi:hypothetical protein
LCAPRLTGARRFLAAASISDDPPKQYKHLIRLQFQQKKLIGVSSFFAKWRYLWLMGSYQLGLTWSRLS